MLHQRARLYALIRNFFQENGVLEVETPLLCQRTVTDPFISSFELSGSSDIDLGRRYLQTSPEFAMKRLLASGSGSIFQITKAFRMGERGRYHNPEFTLLEWYREGFDLEALEDEILHLFHRLGEDFGCPLRVVKVSYLELFLDGTGLHPLKARIEEMANLAEREGWIDAVRLCGEDRANWLDFLFNRLVQPGLSRDQVYFIRPYPALLPSLACRSPHDDAWVERLEIFVGEIEMGNGFFELRDPEEQKARFQKDNEARARLGLSTSALDERLIAALQWGMPKCAGMAIGLDRLLMVLLKKTMLKETLAFDYERA